MSSNVRIVSAGTLRCMHVATLALVALFAVPACAEPASAAPAATTLPDTPVGKFGGEFVHHVNSDTPEQIAKWAPTVLPAAIDKDAEADLVKSLRSAVRDSGGVDLVDVHTQQGMLMLTMKGRRAGQLALLVLGSDPAHPDKLGEVDLVPMDDPALYAGWPKTTVSRVEMTPLIHAAIDRLVRTTDFSGCLTVSDGTNTVFDECRGLADRNASVAVDQQTKFHIGSMDKMFTAIAIAQLVGNGKLSWDSTLAQLVPEYADHAAAQKITVWQLLHHTAGIGDIFVTEFFQNREKFVDPADYLDLIARQPKAGEPGQLTYSNAGYVLLGRIVEKASGENYFDYIQRHVFAPAGMVASGFDSQEDITPKLAVGYFREGPFATQWKANWMSLPFKGSPAGGGYSTNADLLRFANALHDGKLVKPATLAKMFDGEIPAGPGGYAAGFGDRVSHGRHIRGHAGGAPGMNADLAIVWETGASVAVTSNEGDSQTPMMLAETVADLLASEGAKP